MIEMIEGLFDVDRPTAKIIQLALLSLVFVALWLWEERIYRRRRRQEQEELYRKWREPR